MHFAYDETTTDLQARLGDFMAEHVLPSEAAWAEQAATVEDRWSTPPVMEELKAEARARGLWNLFLPHPPYGAGLTNLQYAPLAELTGHSPYIAPEALNGSARTRATWSSSRCSARMSRRSAGSSRCSRGASAPRSR